MKKRKTLREYVDSFPRSVRQFQIAERLGIEATRLSKLLAGQPATRTEVEKLRTHGIERVAP